MHIGRSIVDVLGGIYCFILINFICMIRFFLMKEHLFLKFDEFMPNNICVDKLIFPAILEIFLVLK
jgi:hypothetical protein